MLKSICRTLVVGEEQVLGNSPFLVSGLTERFIMTQGCGCSDGCKELCSDNSVVRGDREPKDEMRLRSHGKYVVSWP